MTARVTVKQRVAELVRQHGSARDAAEAIGVHESVMSLIRSGKRTPGKKVLKKLGLASKVVYYRDGT